MRGFHYVLLAFLLVLGGKATAQVGKPLPADYLQWSASKKLQVTDFQLKIRKGNNLKQSFANFGLQMDGHVADLLGKRGNQLVQNVFYRAGSYLDSTSQLGLDLQLRYLQTLWDIDEVAARQLRQQLRASAKRILFLGKPDVNDLFREAYEAATKRQTQYADETNYGLFVDKQENWERTIAAELVALQAFVVPN
ncbi:MAG: hypothetical protein ACRYG7_37470 [Janthinobacterium lividum]